MLRSSGPFTDMKLIPDSLATACIIKKTTQYNYISACIIKKDNTIQLYFYVNSKQVEDIWKTHTYTMEMKLCIIFILYYILFLTSLSFERYLQNIRSYNIL